jgi:ABC-type polar amino acid transport system ATPase subunit
LRTRRGWVFRNVDLALPTRSVTALAGPAGSGRSMLLLTLAGRARPTTGRLVVAGDERRAAVRRSVAAARVTAAVELEPDLHVVDHVREADLLSRGRADFRWAARVLGLDVDPVAVVGELPTDDATLLAVALALAIQPYVIVVDDVDVAATPAQQERIWAALLAAARTGVAVVASTIDGEVARAAGADVINLLRPVELEGGPDADV